MQMVSRCSVGMRRLMSSTFAESYVTHTITLSGDHRKARGKGKSDDQARDEPAHQNLQGIK